MIESKWIRPGEDISEARALRREVFEAELGWTREMHEDAMDPYSYHLVLYFGDEAVAAGRICYGGVGVARLDRICVKKRYRHQGIGDGLVKVLDYKASQLGMGQSRVETRSDLERFYTRIGFEKTGGSFEKYGMECIAMQKETNDGTRENCAHQCPGKKG